ncbi:N-acetylmuramoyl-L-alanine amidase [Halobacillus sp. Nhm2S1]|uniref:N-acetylmuramoyl-L-alanine amidase n=1 Tax=Halobacillus sp. Nhm2S1 TaxID=2866716 RepID=UPI001C7382ED|nr:N-acetylmuramoyl-L-alanine amidase [Halobacillus sp. Nhm2S1]MBX0358911.1 N-acetylmuramoyl-L-alanine amidase [Halobacillus sp. Nhm2S1]
MAKLLKPKSNWNGKLIALDDGHGMQTPGKRTPYIPELGRSIRENEFNRKVVAFLSDILLEHGFRVLLVAPTDVDTPLNYRTDSANNYKADIYVSIHYNAMSFDFDYSTASGISVHVYLDNLKYESGKLARAVGKYLQRGTRQNWRGYKEDNFHVLRETNMPAILTENGFMDNREEALMMLNEDFQKEVAIEHAQGICEYFGVFYKGTGGLWDKGYLERGDYGVQVKQLQEDLLFLGYDLGGYGADGSFGPATENALKQFQKDQGLVQDGIYGPNTKAAMDDAVAAYEEKLREELIMEKNIFIVNSFKDVAAVEKALKRNGGALKFRYNAEREEVNATDNLYIVGGGRDGLKLGKGKVIDLSGDTAEATASNLYNHFNLV